MDPRTELSTKQKLSAVFIGEGSLTIECAEAFRSAGHEVVCVVAADAKVTQWAIGLDLPHILPDVDVAGSLAEKPFDILFSIVNLSIVPPALLKLPRLIAINFHDGPLPKYAGLYATSWALINQEARHGVTWHEMLPEVDAGRLLKQQTFEISANETAYSLNTKCFEAGIESFAALLHDLESGTPEYADPQLQDRTYFARFKRPEAGGVIVWDRPAEEIAALVRALDFGPYENPLGRAKLALANYAVAVGKADVTSETSVSAPGTVVSIDAESIIVSTTTNDIALSNFETLEGATVALSDLVTDAGLRVGQVLPVLNPASISDLTEAASTLARHESYWTKRLASIESPTLPMAVSSNASPAFERASLSIDAAYLANLDPAAPPGDSLIAVFAAYLSRLTSSAAFTLGFGHVGLGGRNGLEKSLYARQVPFGVSVNSDAGAAESIRNLNEQLRKAVGHETYARDLVSRQPGLKVLLSSAAPVYTVSVALVETAGDFAPPPGSQLTVVSKADGTDAAWYFDSNVFSRERIATMQQQFSAFLAAMLRDGETRLADLPILSEAERQQLQAWNQTSVDVTGPGCINELFEAQAKLTPDAPALAFREEVLSYSQLNCKANRLARRLMALGVGPDQFVGISTDRSTDMVVSMLAVLKAGGGYVPLDPTYPADRLRFIVEDSGIEVLLTQTHLAGQLDAPGLEIVLVDVESGEPYPETNPRSGVGPTNIAYTIYTSGSTGRPKGVIIEHHTVVNFFAGMDAKLDHDVPGVWLAVTSPSFDISVLELLWTLCRGFKVVLHEREEITAVAATAPAQTRRPLDFSLFYFGSHESADENDLYGFLMESARFADDHGWAAVWTPERHFHDFGGAFPNPSVLGAALAANTKQVAIRAGSCVLPLHSPIRVAEEWSVVDNISRGRVGISFASGWQPNDFVLKPENYADAKNIMTRDIDVVRRLWRGETVAFPGHNGAPVDISILPRPVQPELPFWLTAAGSPSTFALAGTLGASILTHLLGQSFDEVASKVQVYRDAWKAAGHAGEGHVTLMLHTFAGDDDAAVKEAVRGPMKAYLASSVSLIKDVASAFPTFQNRLNGGESVDASFAALSAEDMDALLEQAFNRYFETSGLFGRPERCLQTLEKVASIGVDEVACMADFGLSPAEIMDGLQKIEAIRQTWNASVQTRNAGPVRETGPIATVTDLILKHGVTHMQCTPSMASALAQDDAAGLGQLKQMLVGGEALPAPLARDLLRALNGQLINMYGPTETTIWSTCHVVNENDDPVSIGRPLANQQVYVLDPARKQVPVGAIGELYIGGDGVARGYLGRPELTAERFVADPFSSGNDARMYRTGDLVRHLPDGDLEFLGRTDFQVKIRGHRIELGEIESQLLSHPAIREIVAVAREVSAGDQRLVAYWSALAGVAPSTDELRAYARQHLPDYMIPHHFVKVAALPQTPNGKVDRNALPDFASDAEAEPVAEVQPEGDLEETIAGIWKDVLKAPSVSVTTNFFDLGGHSLLALQMHRRLVETVQPSLLLTDIFRFPTIRAMTQFIAAKDGGAEEEAQAAAERASLRRDALSQQRLRRRG